MNTRTTRIILKALSCVGLLASLAILLAAGITGSWALLAIGASVSYGCTTFGW